MGEVVLGELAIAVEARCDGSRQARNGLEVDALAQADRQLGCEVGRLAEDVVEGAALAERAGREQQVDVAGAVLGKQGEVDLDEGLRPPLAADTGVGPSGVQPDLARPGEDHPRDTLAVGERERMGDRCGGEPVGRLVERLTFVEEHRDGALATGADGEDR